MEKVVLMGTGITEDPKLLSKENETIILVENIDTVVESLEIKLPPPVNVNVNVNINAEIEYRKRKEINNPKRQRQLLHKFNKGKR